MLEAKQVVLEAEHGAVEGVVELEVLASSGSALRQAVRAGLLPGGGAAVDQGITWVAVVLA